MTFIDINKARGVKIDVPVFTLNKSGEYGLGKLVKEEKTKDGISRMFEMACFTIDGQPPSIKPKLVSDIVSVCVIKDKAGKDE